MHFEVVATRSGIERASRSNLGHDQHITALAAKTPRHRGV